MPAHTPSDRCTYRDAAGRRCRLPRKPTHPDFCAHHARLNPEGTIEDPQALVAEILGTDPDLSSAQAVNRTAGKLLEAFLARRIPARHAAIAGYLCQLIIQTLPQLRIESTPEGGAPHYFQFISNIPRPDYSKLPGGSPPPGQDPTLWYEIRDGYPAKEVRIDPATMKEVKQP